MDDILCWTQKCHTFVYVMVNPVDLGDERNVSQIGRMLVFDSRTALRRLLR